MSVAKHRLAAMFSRIGSTLERPAMSFSRHEPNLSFPWISRAASMVCPTMSGDEAHPAKPRPADSWPASDEWERGPFEVAGLDPAGRSPASKAPRPLARSLRFLIVLIARVARPWRVSASSQTSVASSRFVKD